MNDQHKSAKIQLNFHEQPPRVSYHLSQNIKTSFPRWNLQLIANVRFNERVKADLLKKRLHLFIRLQFSSSVNQPVAEYSMSKGNCYKTMMPNNHKNSSRIHI